MTDRNDSHETPRFTVVDRRKFRSEDETPAEPKASTPAPTPIESAEPVEPARPRLTLVEPPTPHQPTPIAIAEEPEETLQEPELPPAPSPEEAHFQKAAYEVAAQRLEDLVRAQNPGAPPQEKIGFEHLVQQLYLSAMMQMGAGTPEGQRPRIDILGARQTIDLLAVVLDKTAGNLNPLEDRTLQTVLFELRMTFLELTRMISAQPQPPMPPPPGARR
jgi:hypothetical protein